jgi:hypothetical protein
VLQCLGLFANVLLGTVHSRLVVTSYWFSFTLHCIAAAFYLPFYESFVDSHMNAAYACQVGYVMLCYVMLCYARRTE